MIFSPPGKALTDDFVGLYTGVTKHAQSVQSLPDQSGTQITWKRFSRPQIIIVSTEKKRKDYLDICSFLIHQVTQKNNPKDKHNNTQCRCYYSSKSMTELCRAD